MGAFLIIVLLAILKVGAGLVVLGAALYKVFDKSEVEGVKGWKAFIPYYNLFVWIKLTRNPLWFFILLLHWYILPFWWINALAIMIFTKMALDSVAMFKKIDSRWGYAIIVLILSGVINLFLPVAATATYIVNGLFILAGAGAMVWATNSGEFRKAKYFSKEFSFSDYARKQFAKNKFALFSLYFLGVLIFMAVYSPYIANKQPIYAEYRGEILLPAYETLVEPTKSIKTINPDNKKEEILQYDIADWKRLKLDNVVWTPVPYSPKDQDEISISKGPGETQQYMNLDGFVVDSPSIFRHHMGTDVIGRDVLSGIIHGSKVSLTVGIISMGIASLIGIILGALAGFYGDRNLSMPRIRSWFLVIGIILGWFYGFTYRSYVVSEAFDNSIEEGFTEFFINFLVFFVVVILVTNLARLLEFGWLKKRIRIPIDSIISRSIETLNSIPRLLLIIAIAAVVEERSIILLMVVIGFTSWTGIARFTRAEFLRIRELEYVHAARALGFNNLRIIFRHALPNALAPVFVSIAFGIAAAILIESSLSFLGIGVPDDEVTWGSILSAGRSNIEYWWLVIFPGIAIFFTITIYNLIGEGLRDALDPRLKK